MHDILLNLLLYLLPGIGGAVLIKFYVRNAVLSALINLPGTLVHEICHLVAALLFNGKPSRFSIIPKKEADGSLTLGHVTINNLRWYNGVLIGMAPLVISLTMLLLAPNHWSIGRLGLRDYLFWMVAALLLPSSIPSKVDFKVAATSLVPVALLLFLICLITFFTFRRHLS
jgi:hypothetical protein